MAVDTRSAELATQSFEELMRQFREGSEEAATKIANDYSSHLLRAVRASLPKSIRSKVDSVDLVNTLWGALLVNPTRFAGIRDPAQLMALLAKAARNRVIEEHRKYTTCQARDIRREERLPDKAPALVKGKDRKVSDGLATDSQQDTPSQIVASLEQLRVLVAKLSSRDRKILSCRAHGESYEEIASSVSDISPRTARRVVAKIVEQLLG